MKTNNATAQIIAPLKKIGLHTIAFSHQTDKIEGPITVLYWWREDGPCALSARGQTESQKHLLVAYAIRDARLFKMKQKAEQIAGLSKGG